MITIRGTLFSAEKKGEFKACTGKETLMLCDLITINIINISLGQIKSWKVQKLKLLTKQKCIRLKIHAVKFKFIYAFQSEKNNWR